MKTAIVIVLAMVMMAGVAMAQEQPNIRGLEITGHEIIPPNQGCPDVNVNCNCTETQLPGLWAVNIGGVGRCGELSIISTVFVIYANDGSVKFYPVTQLNKAKQVESCE